MITILGVYSAQRSHFLSSAAVRKPLSAFTLLHNTIIDFSELVLHQPTFMIAADKSIVVPNKKKKEAPANKVVLENEEMVEMEELMTGENEEHKPVVSHDLV